LADNLVTCDSGFICTKPLTIITSLLLKKGFLSMSGYSLSSKIKENQFHPWHLTAKSLWFPTTAFGYYRVAWCSFFICVQCGYSKKNYLDSAVGLNPDTMNVYLSCIAGIKNIFSPSRVFSVQICRLLWV